MFPVAIVDKLVATKESKEEPALAHIKRTIIIVLDSVGVGELPDAHEYGDEGSNTLGNIAAARGGLQLPNMARMGLGNIIPIAGVPPASQPLASYGKMQEQSKGKDTTTGHWEMSGIILESPFPTYPQGFPSDVIEAFSRAIGRGVLGNKVASGTEIIKELGAEHMRTGRPIVYTSADSVFQIAAHEDVIPVDELYSICGTARKILQGEHGVGRVIARPFVGKPGDFQRTANRRDFSLEPIRPTILDILIASGKEVSAVGKISDIFAGRGITRSVKTHSNAESIAETIQYMTAQHAEGLIFTNLVDFDMLWGHRNNVAAYAAGLEEFDNSLPQILAAARPEDLLLITADHGCDPTTASTDHSREYVPLLVWGPACHAEPLGTRSTFADIAATVAEAFSLKNSGPGESFLAQCLGE